MTRATASVVVSEAVTAPEALARVAQAVGSTVTSPETPRAHVRLSPDAVATVDTPKFGEAPPLAIDVTSERGEAAARESAETLAGALTALAGWSVHVITPAASEVGPPARRAPR